MPSAQSIADLVQESLPCTVGVYGIEGNKWIRMMAQLDGVIGVMSEIRDLLASWDNDLAWSSWRIRRQP
jgi:hypothetical protein